MNNKEIEKIKIDPLLPLDMTEKMVRDKIKELVDAVNELSENRAGSAQKQARMMQDWVLKEELESRGYYISENQVDDECDCGQCHVGKNKLCTVDSVMKNYSKTAHQHTKLSPSGK